MTARRRRYRPTVADLNEAYMKLIDHSAEKEIEALDKPLDPVTSEELMALFEQIQNGKGASPRALAYFEDKGVFIPKPLLMWIGFLWGRNLDLIDNEVEVEDIHIGLIFKYKIPFSEERYKRLPPEMRPQPPEPDVVAFHDTIMERIYLAPLDNLAARGRFGALYAWTCNKAAMRMKEETLQEAHGIEATIHPALNSKSFLSLPDKDRTLVTFFNWCIQFHINIRGKYQLCDRLDEVKFQLELSRQFSNWDKEKA
jgi:hypothetical protein